jgi:hypothetical protein
MHGGQFERSVFGVVYDVEPSRMDRGAPRWQLRANPWVVFPSRHGAIEARDGSIAAGAPGRPRGKRGRVVGEDIRETGALAGVMAGATVVCEEEICTNLRLSSVASNSPPRSASRT